MTSRTWSEAVVSVVFVLATVLSATACGQSALSPTSAPASQPATGGATSAEWDQVIVRAKQEGSVLMYGNMNEDQTAPAVAKAFAEKYGIKFEQLALNDAESLAKIKAEQASKTYMVDVMAGSITVNSLSNLDTFVDVGTVPELADGTAKWLADPLAFKPLILSSVSLVGIAFNTKLVPPGTEPKSWKDLADPKYQGKLVMGDPRAAGLPNTLFAHLTALYGEDWLRKVLADNKPTFPRQPRTTTEDLARGQYSIQVAALYRTVQNLQDQGSGLPLKFYFPEEGGMGSQTTLVAVKNAPHPNAARLFINFMMSQEGQAAFALGGNAPLRHGVSVPYPEFQNPDRLKFLQPFPTTAKFVTESTGGQIDINKKLIGQ